VERLGGGVLLAKVKGKRLKAELRHLASQPGFASLALIKG